MTELNFFSKSLETSILDVFLMLKYNYLHCFSVLLDHAYINKHDLIKKIIIFGLFCKLLLYVFKILLNCTSVTKLYHFCKY